MNIVRSVHSQEWVNWLLGKLTNDGGRESQFTCRARSMCVWETLGLCETGQITLPPRYTSLAACESSPRALCSSCSAKRPIITHFTRADYSKYSFVLPDWGCENARMRRKAQWRICRERWMRCIPHPMSSSLHYYGVKYLLIRRLPPNSPFPLTLYLHVLRRFHRRRNNRSHPMNVLIVNKMHWWKCVCHEVKWEEPIVAFPLRSKWSLESGSYHAERASYTCVLPTTRHAAARAKHII